MHECQFYVRVGHYFELNYVSSAYLFQKSVTCLQVDGGTRPTPTLAVFSNNTEVIKHATCQVFHLTGGVGGSGAVGCMVLSTYS